jgi:glycerophosphoryl diester phosphodiesterase
MVNIDFNFEADYIEVDLVPTKDHRLIAMHDNKLSIATDIFAYPTFLEKRTTKLIDG